ncbi:monocarboxylate transporter 14 [Plakobranchus ocellatus]|uniref:Monocarboxylate transporter 14 n=1 Tax=Plakobranchus ocellatus TaxID=259542 RepID=A0AAV4E102_9GAST|nr:monocarboxylate transporter 14 [Plakobranchus ocellatus]
MESKSFGKQQNELEEVVYLAHDQGDQSSASEPTNSKTPLLSDGWKREKLHDHSGDDDDDDDDIDKVEEEVIDSSFGWVIVFGGFLSQMLTVGLMRTDGVYFLQFREKFHESAQLCAWPGAISLTVQSFIGPVASALCNRFSVRTTVIIATLFNITGLILSGFCTNIIQLFITYGLLQGIGRGLTVVSGIFIVNMYFDKMRARSIGISMAGAGLGTFAMVPLNQWFFDTFGFTYAFFWIASLATSGFLMAALFRPLSMHVEIKKAEKLRKIAARRQRKQINGDVINAEFVGENKSITNVGIPDAEKSEDFCTNEGPQEQVQQEKSCFRSVLNTCFPIEHNQRGKKGGKKGKIFHFELLKDVPFLIMCISMVLFNLANKSVFSFLPAIGFSKGLTNSEASLLISAVGVGDTLARVSAGFVIDHNWMRLETLFGAVLFLCAGVSLMIALVRGFALFCLAAGLYGCFAGVSISQKPTLLAVILGKEMLTSSFGIMYSFQGLGTISGPPISGALRDSLGSYDYAFYMTAACMGFAGVLYIISCILFTLRSRREAREAGSCESTESDAHFSASAAESYQPLLKGEAGRAQGAENLVQQTLVVPYDSNAGDEDIQSDDDGDKEKRRFLHP